MHDNDLKEKSSFLSTAQTYLDQGLYKEASDHAELWLRDHPMDADATIVYCHALMKTGKLNRVEEVLEGVEDTILHLSQVYAFMGDICLEGGLTREAIRFYRKFISINPDTTDAEKLSDKLRTFTSAPDEPAEETASDQDEGIDQVAPDFYTVTLADLYIRQGYLQMAADVLDEILRNDSENRAAADKFNEVKVMLKDKKHKEEVVGELTRWLNNMDRIRCHAS